jgi:hypothetical protein
LETLFHNVKVKNPSSILPCGSKRILVLEDYKTLYDIIEQRTEVGEDDDWDTPLNETPSRHMVITGNPGIGTFTLKFCKDHPPTVTPSLGKSCFLSYCLLRRIAEGKRTTFSCQGDTAMVYQFDKNGVRYISIDTEDDIDDDRKVWHLTDDTPPVDLYKTKQWIIIHATSPAPHKYKDWSKYANAQCFYVDLWSWDEMVMLW